MQLQIPGELAPDRHWTAIGDGPCKSKKQQIQWEKIGLTVTTSSNTSSH